MFKNYVDDEQFNLQINRFINDELADNQIVKKDIEEIVPQLKDA